MFPMSIAIQRDFFLLNHWPRYERSLEVPIWNDFELVFLYTYFMSLKEYNFVYKLT